MENRKFIITFVPALALGFFVLAQEAQAYGVPTHALLTKEVVDFYNARAADNKIPDELKNYLLDGARREDDLPRWMNHFYDPVHGNGLKSVAYGSGYASKEWAEDRTKQNDLKYKARTFLASILTAIQERNIRAITAETDFTWERGIRFYANGEKEKGLFILGHVLHLVEDASVPDHTRNDPHPGFGEDYSPYENYAKKYDLDNPDKDLSGRLNGKAALDFATLNGYFESLANYSNNNFYSKDTIGIQSGFPSPEPTDFELKDGFYYGIHKTGDDGKFYLVLKKNRSGSMLFGNNKEFSIDDEIIKSDYWSRLSTKAVQHGAGVIELFFAEVEKVKNDPARLKEPKSVVGQAVDVLRKAGSNIGSTLGGISLTGSGGEVLDVFSLDDEEDAKPAASASTSANTKNNSGKTTTTPLVVPKNAPPPASPKTQENVLGANDEPASTTAKDTAAKDTAPVPECAFDGGGTTSRSPILINEVAWMGGENGATKEWIELKNISSGIADVSGWQVRDKDGQIKTVIPGGTKIPSGGFYLLERGEDATAVSSDQIYAGGLKNDNEALRLFNGNCGLVDEAIAATKWPAGDNATKQTMERDASGFGWQTSANAGGTPRAENSVGVATQSSSGGGRAQDDVVTPPPAAPPAASSGANHIVISEIMTGTAASSTSEFIELYNPTDVEADLSGWYIKRKATETSVAGNLISKTSGAFDGKRVKPHGYLLIGSNQYSGAADVRYSQNSIYMAENGDVLLLYDISDGLVDEVSYGEIEVGKSWERQAYGNGCVSPQNDGEFLGNGCDSGSVADFELREIPNPQNAASLPEPRSAPAAVRGFEGSFSSGSVELIFNWEASRDVEDNATSVTYKIKDKDSGAALYNGPNLGARVRVTEVGRVYPVSITAIDRDGLSATSTEEDIDAPSYLDNLHFYESAENSAHGGRDILELRYGSYPFLPSVYRYGGGNFYHQVFFYLNGIPAIADILNFGNGFRPTADLEPLTTYYPTCGGSNADAAHSLLSLEDDISNPANCVGGFRADRLSYNQIQSRALTVPVGPDGSFDSDDYVTAVFYGRHMPDPGESLKLIAVDKTKYRFLAGRPNYFAPMLGGGPDLELKKAEGKLAISWGDASDKDTDQNFIFMS